MEPGVLALTLTGRNPAIITKATKMAKNFFT
jgi:hypothetical protein